MDGIARIGSAVPGTSQDDPSGAAVAAEAHEAGAVVAVDEQPLQDCELRFTWRGDHQAAQEFLTALALKLIAEQRVAMPYQSAVVERPAVMGRLIG